MKLFQIYEEDLATLEAALPKLVDKIETRMDNADRVRIRNVQAVLSRVRWNYGPHFEGERIPVEGGDDGVD